MQHIAQAALVPATFAPASSRRCSSIAAQPISRSAGRTRPSVRRGHVLRAERVGAGSAAPGAQLPTSSEEQVKQAVQAAQRAMDAGLNRMTLELQLPLIGATDLDDWPGGIRQQYKAAGPMVQAFLKALDPAEAVLQRVIDDADAIVELTSGTALKALVFPTAEAFNEVERLSKEKVKAAIMVNPQWNTSVNVIPDFGFGPWRKAKEDLVASFTEVYSLRDVRIRGQVTRVLRAFPGNWNVFAIGAGAPPLLIGTLDKRPTFKDLEALVDQQKDSIANQDWVQRAKSEFKFNADSLKEKPK